MANKNLFIRFSTELLHIFFRFSTKINSGEVVVGPVKHKPTFVVQSLWIVKRVSKSKFTKIDIQM